MAGKIARQSADIGAKEAKIRQLREEVRSAGTKNNRRASDVGDAGRALQDKLLEVEQLQQQVADWEHNFREQQWQAKSERQQRYKAEEEGDSLAAALTSARGVCEQLPGRPES